MIFSKGEMMPLAAAAALRHEPRPHGCAGKVRYPTLTAAQDVLIKVVAEFRAGTLDDRHPERPMSVYQCGSCRAWHIGHTFKGEPR